MQPLRESVAVQRYLDRHIEQDLPPPPPGHPPWNHALVIPAYSEPASVLPSLQRIPTDTGRVLVILVLNHPDSDTHDNANQNLRCAVEALPGNDPRDEASLYRLTDQTDIYLYDLDRRHGPLPAAMGVGLARKFGCDLALKWICEGAVQGRWICCTDADALLPADYFQQLEASSAAAAVFPFWHAPGPSEACNAATALYELRLHHYVLGLEYAGSPYAFHTLGSCIAVDADAYAQVRGFPKRAGAEDFYLLNKIAKTGPIARLGGACIELQSRVSKRVPFGTGPAVQRIAEADDSAGLALFYHPQIFHALKLLLRSMPRFFTNTDEKVKDILLSGGLEQELAVAAATELETMGLAAALEHCRRQGKSIQQFASQFHQWFDGFRTLKFVHAMERHAWPRQSITQLQTLQANFWPTDSPTDSTTEQLLNAVRRHWSWSTKN